jgi:oligosaccharyltransferase complex subunit alpha (ribophorin I)
VKYQVTTSAHLKKPLAVATAFFGLFTVAFLARRVDLTIHQKKK